MCQRFVLIAFNIQSVRKRLIRREQVVHRDSTPVLPILPVSLPSRLVDQAYVRVDALPFDADSPLDVWNS